MKKILFTALLLTQPALAVEKEVVQMPVYCMSEKEMDRILSKHGEVSFVGGTSTRVLEGGKRQHHPIILFVNPDTRTWTLVERAGEYYCAISLGEDLVPITKEDRPKSGV